MRYLKTARPRSEEDRRELVARVAAIIADVAARGDGALAEMSERFDGSTRSSFRVSSDEIDAAYAKLTKGELDDMRSARENIAKFAARQLASVSEVDAFEPSPGIVLGHRVVPVRSCCCYVPGGNYPLYSTALMLATPAKIAGVARVAACSPVVRGTCSIDHRTLAAMDIAGADEIYAVGGAQAAAAFALGTEQIAPVDMIVGPGSAYVTEAKRQLFGRVGIDFIAGPSEVMVIADAGARADVIAADALAQSEHDVNAAAIIVTTDESLGRAVMREVEAQLAALPTAEIARRAWEDNGEVVLAETIDEAIEIANDRAPEHLEIQTSCPDELVSRLACYGSLFIGAGAAEVFGDYASGTNHTLPTMRAARYTGGVWVGTFLKTMTHQRMTPEAARALSAMTARMARGEGLEAHARAAEIRATL